MPHLAFTLQLPLVISLFFRMPIQEKPLKHWMDNFYGYGSWDASIWFVSYEEGGGDLPEEVAEKTDYFLESYPSNTFPTLCDIRNLYRRVSFRIDGPKASLFENLYEYRFGNGAQQNSVWKNLISFVHGFRDQKIFDPLDYQKKLFASALSKREALIILYPLPSPHNHAWYYSWLDLPNFPFLKSRALYEQHLYGSRVRTILNKIAECNPDLVLMYGMNNINSLKKSVSESFPGVKFRMVKAKKLKIPQYHRADLSNGTTLLVTTQIPALRHNRPDTGFDWQEFGITVKSAI